MPCAFGPSGASIAHDPLPPDIDRTPTAWRGHAPFAAWLVEELRPRLIVELGVFAGFSLGCFCDAVRRTTPPLVGTRCVGVDTFAGDPQSGYYGANVYEHCTKIVQRYPFASLAQMEFDKAAKNFADGSINILHIDGCHDYDSVKNDFTRWLPKVSRASGVVLLHDTCVPHYGVGRFYAELVHPKFTFTHSFGLGVIDISCTCTALCKIRETLALGADIESIEQFFGGGVKK